MVFTLAQIMCFCIQVHVFSGHSVVCLSRVHFRLVAHERHDVPFIAQHGFKIVGNAPGWRGLLHPSAAAVRGRLR